MRYLVKINSVCNSIFFLPILGRIVYSILFWASGDSFKPSILMPLMTFTTLPHFLMSSIRKIVKIQIRPPSYFTSTCIVWYNSSFDGDTAWRRHYSQKMVHISNYSPLYWSGQILFLTDILCFMLHHYLLYWSTQTI